MSVRVVLSCDGHRHGQKCRGALYTTPDGPDATVAAVEYVRAAGWRFTAIDAVTGWTGDLCPSGGHDEDEGAAAEAVTR